MAGFARLLVNRFTAVVAGVLLLASCALDDVVKLPDVSSGGGNSRSTIAAGLKEALRVGTERAVANTSRRGGFLDNPLLRIVLPEQLDSVVQTLRTIGLGVLVERFEVTMNRAAERAAAEAFPVFWDTITAMTLEDVYGIFNGGPTAATDFFRRRTSATLRERFKPVVESNMNQLGLYRTYTELITPYQQLPFTKDVDLDLSNYVTGKALDGLFTVIGDEEARIRSDPVARTTELLRQVFGG